MVKVAIAGYGIEGESNYRYWSALGADVTIFDEHDSPERPLPAGANVQTGSNAFSSLNSYDLVVRTAGLAPHKITTDGKIWSATQEFFARCQVPIIGVTGTKGKGTTASLIASILRASGRAVHLLGNIGAPALDTLPKVRTEDIIVYELSSFQLWDLERSPHVAVVLMIEPDHLDVHDSMDDYVIAKANIARWQKTSDITVFNPNNSFSKRIGSMTPGRSVPYNKAPGCEVRAGAFVIDDQKLCSIEALSLPGPHNLDNTCAAITAAWQFTRDNAAIEQGLRNFKGLPHRLKFVREVAEVTYYDDSIATTPGSAIAAIRAFSEPKVLILGGSDKAADFTELSGRIAADKGIRKIIAIGQTGPRIAKLLHDKNFQNVELLASGKTTMEDIVQAAQKAAHAGDIVIMSPACASFDMFKNYQDRGEQYVKAVQSL